MPLMHPGDRFGLFHLCFSPDGKLLLTGSKDGQARLWNWSQGTLACPPMRHADEIYSVAFMPDGKYVLTSCRGNEGAIHFWESSTGKQVAPPFQLGSSVTTLALAPDGSKAFACLGSKAVIVPLSDLLSAPDRSLEDLRLIGEVGSSSRIEMGDVDGLTMEQWLDRWEKFHRRRAEYEQVTWTEVVSTTTRHRLQAQRLLTEGHADEAVAMWMKAVTEIERVANGEPVQKLRAEIFKEARTRLQDRFEIEPANEVLMEAFATNLLEFREPVQWTTINPH